MENNRYGFRYFCCPLTCLVLADQELFFKRV